MKGQAVVEYLTTYGWAILGLLIVIAVLFSSGILSPNYLISEECSFGTSFRCDSAFFNEGQSSKMLVNIFNGFPYKVKVVKFELWSSDTHDPFTGFDGNIDLSSGSSNTFSGLFSGQQVQEGHVKRFIGNITYVSCAPENGPDCSSIEHVVTGRVVAKIIPQ